MRTRRSPWLITGILGLAFLSACGREQPTAPQPETADKWSSVDEDLRRELVPGLDIWSQARRPDPVWEAGVAAPDDLSRAKRHHEFMQAGVPLEYRSRRSPYPATTQIIHDGGKLYRSHCATCHDPTGLGEGEANRDLTPPPAFLAYLIDRPRSVDEYLLWSIAEGGEQFGTEMPAYKKVLTERQIWQIIIYMRAGFPNVEKAGWN